MPTLGLHRYPQVHYLEKHRRMLTLIPAYTAKLPKGYGLAQLLSVVVYPLLRVLLPICSRVRLEDWEIEYPS